MIVHIVMWKLSESALGQSKEQNAQKLKIMIENLKSIIPQIIKAEVGFNVNVSPAAFDVVLYSEFADSKDLQIYQEHPEHKKVAEFLSEAAVQRNVVDYEK